MTISNNLEIIDFTKGIKSEQVQHNFRALQDQIKKERSIVAGSGVIEGLTYNTGDPYNIEKEGFPFTVNNGIFIDVDGNEVSFLSDTVYILSPTPMSSDLPLLSRQVGADGVMSIKEHVPYASTGLTISANDPENNGLNFTDSNGNPVTPVLSTPSSPSIITNSDMSETLIKFDAVKYGGRLLSGTYTTAQPHDELIYIGTDHKLHTVPSIDSSSPSIMDSVPADCIYLLCAVGIEIFPSAKVVIKKDFQTKRNIYTDSDNQLYIRGINFDDLQIVYMKEPTKPNNDTLWYDVVTNKLMVWATHEGISGWVAVNDFSTHPVLRYKIWDPTLTQFNNPGDLGILPTDLKTFMFDPVKELDMLFINEENELQVIVDNSILMSDEFEEITKFDTMTPQELDTSTYENYGIGFRLKEALRSPGYVEARITHRVYENPLRPRFQRTATFVSEGVIKYTSLVSAQEYFETNIPYKYGEGQLEVFVQGRKLLPRVPDIETNLDYEFLEDSDDLEDPKVKGAQLKKFKIPSEKLELLSGQYITYRITTSIYSYDNIFKVIEDALASIQVAVNKSTQALEAVDDLTTDVNDRLGDVFIELGANRSDLEAHKLSREDFYNSTTGTLKYDRMPTEIKSWIPKGFINKTIIKASDIIQLENITDKDFLIVVDIESNQTLIRGVDYLIGVVDGVTYLTLSQGKVLNNHTIYLTGIKL